MTPETYLIQKAANRAGEILGLIEWYDDLELIEIWKCLYTMADGDETLMRHWMQTRNTYLQCRVPANIVVTQQGTQDILSQVSYYSQ